MELLENDLLDFELLELPKEDLPPLFPGLFSISSSAFSSTLFSY